MHPILSHRGWLALYFVAWTALAALSAIALVSPDYASWPAAVLVCLPTNIAGAAAALPIWFVCKALPLSASGWHRAIVAHAVAAGLWGLSWPAVCNLVDVLIGSPLGTRLYAQDSLLIVTGVSYYLIAAALWYALAAMLRASSAEAREIQTRLRAREAELDELKAQIQPHFLFNALNALSALITQNPQRAREMCVELADLLRRGLQLATRTDVSLSDEMELVRTYLSIEAVRMGERLRISEEIDASAGKAALPPLILQPLVENAITHGIALLAEGGELRIRASRREGRLQIDIVNPYDSAARARRHPSGFGLRNVARRLDALYGAEAALTISRQPKTYSVTVSLPYQEVRA